MRIYLDNCCYNRPFDEQAQLLVRLENLGNVEAERFVCLMNQGAGDYTQWRRDHLFVGETVHSLAEKARQTGDMLRALEPAQS